jgi:multiple sugar transport system permease protein/sn-glycerol 3-phosphate transport system permease protein
MPASTLRPWRRRTPVWTLALLVLAGLVFLIPAYWMITAAFKPNGDIYQWPLNLWPETFTWDNFTTAFAAAPFDRFFLNSLIITSIGATVKLVLAVCTAYAFAFLPFPGKKWLFLGILGALMVPGHVTLLINYVTVGNLGLINSYAGIILPGLGSAFGTFLLRQHFLSLPPEVMEAAELDGAGHLRRLLHFALPMSIPAVVTVGLIAVIDDWNEFIWPMLVTNTLDMRTMPIGLMYLKQTEGMNDWGAIMAGTVLVVLPMLLLFLAAQRFIVAGLAGSVVKH